jgi:hypothetical protein
METRKLWIGSVLLSLTVGLAEAAPPRTEAKPPSPALRAVRKVLEVGPKENAEAALALYREAAAQAVRLAPANQFVKEGLDKAWPGRGRRTPRKRAGSCARRYERRKECSPSRRAWRHRCRNGGRR